VRRPAGSCSPFRQDLCDGGTPLHMAGRPRAGLERDRDLEGHADLHALRHRFGTRFAERGDPRAKLKRLMRHATEAAA
jgi:hypothetical protein